MKSDPADYDCEIFTAPIDGTPLTVAYLGTSYRGGPVDLDEIEIYRVHVGDVDITEYCDHGAVVDLLKTELRGFI